jgi:8-oxo-dGTP pyrophosphatase MutT (NUDIX family)
MTGIGLEQVRAALALAEFDVDAARHRMAPQPRTMRRSTRRPGTPRQASVLLLLFPAGGGLAFVLVRRSENERDVHSGQISLPGGAQEPGETIVETALRETEEELGVRETVQILGTLSCLYIPPSDFEVYPVVGYLPERPIWQLDPAEVREVFECPVAWLLDEGRKVIADWELGDRQLRVPWYNVHDHCVWGATAILLSEFEQRLRAVMAS